MQASNNCRELLHTCEGCKLEAYPDPAWHNVPRDTPPSSYPEALKGRKWGDPWTIGWGHTGPAVKEGLKWTQAQADAVFEQDLSEKAVEPLNGLLRSKLAKRVVTQGQFDALASFCYNLGAKRLAGSTLFDMFVAGNLTEAADQFLKWNKAGGQVLKGLTRRRRAERAMFLAQDWRKAYNIKD